MGTYEKINFLNFLYQILLPTSLSAKEALFLTPDRIPQRRSVHSPPVVYQTFNGIVFGNNIIYAARVFAFKI